jgi:hypothetical protein
VPADLIPQDNRSRRGVFGRCADCGDVLPDITMLVCPYPCRKKFAHDPKFLEREAGHRERITDLFRGVHDPSLTFEKANAIYERKRKAREAEAA